MGFIEDHRNIINLQDERFMGYELSHSILGALYSYTVKNVTGRQPHRRYVNCGNGWVLVPSGVDRSALWDVNVA